MVDLFRGESEDHRVTVYADMIVLDGHYEIEFSRIADWQGLLEWTFHLNQKTWVSKEMVNQVIHEVCAAKGWELHRGL